MKCILGRAAAIAGLTSLGATLPALAADYSFTVFNYSGVDLQTLFVTPHDWEEWGDDFLELTDSIADGSADEITLHGGADTCYYDIWAEFGSSPDAADITDEAFLFAVDLCQVEAAGGLVFLPDDLYSLEEDLDEAFIRIVNNTETTVVALIASPAQDSGNPATEVDLLDRVYLSPYEYFALPLSQATANFTACHFDLTVYSLLPGTDITASLTEDDIQETTLPAIDLCSSNQVPIGEGPIERIRVKNTTDMHLSELYISPTESDDWGIDQLIFELAPGAEEAVLLPLVDPPADGDAGLCVPYDVLGIFHADADSPKAVLYEEYALDLCDDDAMTLNFSNPELFYEEDPAW